MHPHTMALPPVHLAVLPADKLRDFKYVCECRVGRGCFLFGKEPPATDVQAGTRWPVLLLSRSAAERGAWEFVGSAKILKPAQALGGGDEKWVSIITDPRWCSPIDLGSLERNMRSTLDIDFDGAAKQPHVLATEGMMNLIVSAQKLIDNADDVHVYAIQDSRHASKTPANKGKMSKVSFWRCYLWRC